MKAFFFQKCGTNVLQYEARCVIGELTRFPLQTTFDIMFVDLPETVVVNEDGFETLVPIVPAPWVLG